MTRAPVTPPPAPAGMPPDGGQAPRWIDPRRVPTGVPMVTTHTTTLGQLIRRVAKAIQEMPR